MSRRTRRLGPADRPGAVQDDLEPPRDVDKIVDRLVDAAIRLATDYARASGPPRRDGEQVNWVCPELSAAEPVAPRMPCRDGRAVRR